MGERISGGSDQLGDFLRSRRALVQPEEVGLPVFGRRRRVPGLRREEVAQLAGVSVDYYVRLEQGRGRGVSDGVLDAVARVLRLDAVERAHLADLARPERRPGPPDASVVRPGVRMLLDTLAGPAVLLGRCMDVLAWNAAAEELYGLAGRPERDRNMARHAFTDPLARTFYADWPAVAADTVAYLRLEAARRPADGRLAALVDELAAGSPEFRALWAEHRVREKTHGRKVFRRPDGSLLDLPYETLVLPGDPDQLLVAFTAPVPAGEPRPRTGAAAAV
ncbi:helix-turn-helix transcriptional regulator [Kitasatospora sp. NPDC059571]|uniref:helix-turn-helix transcriptional regulator n=1 Tax=Kitasatospora sp. NPDC059571 TaxID=3346871 RepID=UPI0036BF2E15